MAKYKQKLGKWGEDLACDFFVDRGSKLIERNWRTKFGEIDIIFTNDTDIIFVEVKTRTTPAFGYGEQAVNDSKKKKINKTLKQFLLEHSQFDNYFPRFDILVVEIKDLKPKYIHYENVSL